MRLIAKLAETFDDEAFEACYAASRGGLKTNWFQYKYPDKDDAWYAGDEAKASFKEMMIDRWTNEERSCLAIVIRDADSDNRPMAVVCGVKSDEYEGAMFMQNLLLNTDTNGSKNWITDWFLSDNLRLILQEAGYTRWYTKVLGDQLAKALGRALAKESPDGSLTAFIKGSYGW